MTIKHITFSAMMGTAAASLPAEEALPPDAAKGAEERVEDLLSRLTLGEKIDMIGGVRDFYVRGHEGLNLPELKMSDGPVGVRNYGPATAYPCGIALAATWDVALARRYGAALGRDSRARGVHFLLAPGVNIYRVPHCGRNFEYFGEDPHLAARIAVGYIRGVQSQGVAATVKHFAANNHEHDRGNDSSEVDERTLHEIYFPAFRAAVQEAGVQAVMCSYNLINGTYTSANDWLLNRVLKAEWGFAGIVMSDWGAAHETLRCVNGGLDLEMPSGQFMHRGAIRPLLESGRITEGAIDDKVRRILRVMVAMGWLERPQHDPSIPLDDMENAAVALETARAGMVLLKNRDGLLPLERSAIKTIAVVGPNADPAVVGGGGSSFTQPFMSVSVLEGIRYKAGSDIEVIHVPVGGDAPYQEIFKSSRCTGPWRVEFFNNRDLAGEPIYTREDETIDFDWGQEPPAKGLEKDRFSARWTGAIRPGATGEHLFVLRSDDGSRLRIDGKIVIDMWSDQRVRVQSEKMHLEAGATYELQVEYFDAGGAAIAQFGWARNRLALPAEAAAPIARADAAVVCVGFNAHLESEGFDRPFELPNGQDDLIAAVAEANPHTVVVLNSGGAMDMRSWLDRVPALLQAWYPGQSGGTAVAEILFGDVNPSGKLPASFEKRWEDAAAYGNFPAIDRKIYYREGVFVGYRHFDARNIEPQFPFGFGLSYTTFEYGKLTVTPVDGGCEVVFDLTNTGPRAGAEVAQLYVAPPKGRVPRPPRELKGFAKVTLAPGETQRIHLALERAAFAHYDAEQHLWRVEPGTYTILVGTASRDLRLQERIEVAP